MLKLNDVIVSSSATNISAVYNTARNGDILL
jgi:hypothetical protein